MSGPSEGEHPVPHQLLPGMRVTHLGVPAEDGMTSARWGQADVLVKGNTAHPNVVVNEYLANRLALVIGVPVPMGDIWIDEDGEAHWVVAAVRTQGFGLPPASPTELARIPEPTRARMLLFDTLIYNPDRHENNVLADDRGNAWLIDHEQALFGEMHEDARDGILTLADRPYRDLCAFWTGEARPSAQAVAEAATHIQVVPLHAMTEAFGNARRHGLLKAADAEAALAMLSARRDNVRRLVDQAAVARPAVDTDDLLVSGNSSEEEAS